MTIGSRHPYFCAALQTGELIVEAAASLCVGQQGDPFGGGAEGDALAGQAGADPQRDARVARPVSTLSEYETGDHRPGLGSGQASTATRAGTQQTCERILFLWSLLRAAVEGLGDSLDATVR